MPCMSTAAVMMLIHTRVYINYHKSFDVVSSTVFSVLVGKVFHWEALAMQFMIFLARLGLMWSTASARSFQDGGGSTWFSQLLIISLTHCWQFPGWFASIRSKICSGMSNRVPIICQFLASGRSNLKQFLGDRVIFTSCFCFLRCCSILSTLRLSEDKMWLSCIIILME